MTQSDLPAPDVMLHFEKISLGNEPEANRRWQVSVDGTVRFSKNQPPVAAGQVHNQALTELHVLTADELQTLLATASEAGFWNAPERIVDSAVEDGMSLRLTLRDGKRIKRIVADNAKSTVIDAVTNALFGMIQPE